MRGSARRRREGMFAVQDESEEVDWRDWVDAGGLCVIWLID